MALECKNCGAVNLRIEARFCDQCGGVLNIAPAQIDRGDINMDTYIEENNYVMTQKDQISNIKSMFKFSDPKTPLPDEDMLYVRKGSNSKAAWYFILEKETARLWVTVDYTAQLIETGN